MATYRIVCTDRRPSPHPTHHPHIVAVGTVRTGSDSAKATKKWSLDKVLAAMDEGDRFYTKGERSQEVAEVGTYRCVPCGRTYIRSAPDTATDDNLDNLRPCSWKKRK